MRLPTRRTIWPIASLIVVVVVGIGLFVPLTPRSRLTQANFDRIRDGMSEAEVMVILGPPSIRHEPSPGDTVKTIFWLKGGNWICVWFDKDMTYMRHLHMATAHDAMWWYLEKIGISND